MLRDQIVVGIQDKSLSEWLQLYVHLTLDSAIKQICQREAVREQQQLLGSGMKNNPIIVDEVTRQSSGAGGGYQPLKRKQELPKDLKGIHLNTTKTNKTDLSAQDVAKVQHTEDRNAQPMMQNATNVINEVITVPSAERKTPKEVWMGWTAT